MEKLFTASEVAAIFKVKMSTLYDWVHFRKIGCTKVGGLKFTETHLSDFVAGNTVQAKSRPKKAPAGKRRRSCRVPAGTLAIIADAKEEVLPLSSGGSCAKGRRDR